MEYIESYRIIYNYYNNNNECEIIENIKYYNPYFCKYNTSIYNNIAINPLHQALHIGDIHMTEKLSRDFNMLTCVDHKSGYYPLHTACSKPDVKGILLDLLEYDYIVKLLESTRINYYKLTRAECVYIIREAISGNRIDQLNTYLPKIRELMAIEVQIVKMLLDRRADINCRDEKYNLKPLYNAIESRNIDMVNLLLSYGADPNELTPNSYTSLDYAILHSTADIFKILMEACNEITKKIHIILTLLYTKMLKYLLVC